MTLRACPNCGSAVFVPRISEEEMRREVEARNRFVEERASRLRDDGALMDLTRFMHGDPDPLVACRQCGLVVRDEAGSASYETDVYDPDVLAQLYPRYLKSFEHKMEDLAQIVPPRAEVLEVGSHMGAFLEAAERRDWRPTGFDVGESASAFARRRGVRVKLQALEDARVAGKSADAVCVWNCFDQVEDPAPLLRRAYEVLKRHAVLVVRTPNFEFYRRMRERGARRALGYNNLLGFPYLVGYTPRTLNAAVARHGFEPIAGRNSALLTMPLPEPSPKVAREMRANLRDERGWTSRLTGAWIEVAYRKLAG